MIYKLAINEIILTSTSISDMSQNSAEVPHTEFIAKFDGHPNHVYVDKYDLGIKDPDKFPKRYSSAGNNPWICYDEALLKIKDEASRVMGSNDIHLFTDDLDMINSQRIFSEHRLSSTENDWDLRGSNLRNGINPISSINQYADSIEPQYTRRFPITYEGMRPTTQGNLNLYDVNERMKYFKSIFRNLSSSADEALYRTVKGNTNHTPIQHSRQHQQQLSNTSVPRQPQGNSSLILHQRQQESHALDPTRQQRLRIQQISEDELLHWYWRELAKMGINFQKILIEMDNEHSLKLKHNGPHSKVQIDSHFFNLRNSEIQRYVASKKQLERQYLLSLRQIKKIPERDTFNPHDPTDFFNEETLKERRRINALRAINKEYDKSRKTKVES